MSLLGTAYMQAGQLNKGTSYFSKAADAAPDAASIRTQLALSHLAQGQSDEAAGDLKMALDIDKDSSRAGILLALLELRKGEYDKALASAKSLEGMKSMKDNPLPQNLMGAAYLGKKDEAKAAEMFNAALKIKPDFVPARMNLAQLAIRDKKYDEARQQYEAVLKESSKNVEAMTALANLANVEKKPDEVVKWLRMASDTDPKGVAPQIRLITFYNSQRRFNDALTVARQLNIDVPNNPRVLEVLGRAEMAAGNPDRAISTFRQLAEVVPKSGRALVLLAGAQLGAKDTDASRRTLQKAIEVDPNYTPGHVSLVQLELREKNYDAALKAADNLGSVEPKSPAGDMMRGDVMMAQKKPAEAVTAYKAGLKLAQSSALVLRLYNAEREAGNKKEAYATLSDWLDKHKDDNAVRNILASAYLLDGSYDKAIKESEVLLAVRQDNPVVLNNLAWLYQKTGDKRATEYAERAYKAAPKSPAVMDTLGWILVQNGKADRGAEILKQATEAAPNMGDILYHRAAALEKAGHREEARKELEKLLASADKMQGFSTRKDAEALLDHLKSGG